MEELKNDKFTQIGLYFLFKSYDKKSLEEFLKEYSLEDLIKYYDKFNTLYLDEDELFNYFDGDYEKVAKDLALFFAPFLPEDFIMSKDLEKLKSDLSKIYGDEIADAIVKALEILSLLGMDYDIKEKKYLLKEVFKIMHLLAKILKILKVNDA
ncbi:MAG: hypothetical protein ABGX26_07580 [Nautiliaceae bacterium]|jgi:hypothetical protein